VRLSCLGAAVCTFALQRFYEEDGRQGIVYCLSKPACSLYESIGFRIHASLIGDVNAASTMAMR
jgi:hypothetical protein